MSHDPDFVVTIGGKDVTKYVQEWEVVDDEQGMSTVMAVLGNPDMVNSGLAVTGDTIALRYGNQGDMQGKIEFPIMPFKERYPRDGQLTCTYTGYDPTKRLAGGKMKGCFDDGKKLQEAAEATAKSEDLQYEGGAQEGPDLKKFRIPVANMNKKQAIRTFQKASKSKHTKKGGGKSATSPLQDSQKPVQGFNGTVGKGLSRSGAGQVPEDQPQDNNLDGNRVGNDHGQAAGEPVKGLLIMVGLPWIRAKQNVEILNVGPVASGTYYVAKAAHKWSKGDGYVCECDLIRSGTGKGGCGRRCANGDVRGDL